MVGHSLNLRPADVPRNRSVGRMSTSAASALLVYHTHAKIISFIFGVTSQQRRRDLDSRSILARLIHPLVCLSAAAI
jgi:hypothetical protein